MRPLYGERMGELIPFRRRDAAPSRPPRPNRKPEGADPVEPLWRTAAGAALRQARYRRGQTLTQVAARAGISVQYLSEVERGRKEPSSEILAAVAGALDLTLAELTGTVTRSLVSIRTDTVDRVPPTTPRGPVALAV